jgi:hypothetical protein
MTDATAFDVLCVNPVLWLLLILVFCGLVSRLQGKF